MNFLLQTVDEEDNLPCESEENPSGIYERQFTLPVPIPDEEKKLTQIFVFKLVCGFFVVTQKVSLW